MSVDLDALNQTTSDVCQAMLGLSLRQEDVQPLEGDQLLASIRIRGAWNARLDIAGPVELATKIAETMYDKPPAELSTTEILDAFGEVVNMIGGNIKGIVDADTVLSLPCVSFADRPIDETDSSQSATFVCAGYPFYVVLFETADVVPANA